MRRVQRFPPNVFVRLNNHNSLSMPFNRLKRCLHRLRGEFPGNGGSHAKHSRKLIVNIRFSEEYPCTTTSHGSIKRLSLGITRSEHYACAAAKAFLEVGSELPSQHRTGAFAVLMFQRFFCKQKASFPCDSIRWVVSQGYSGVAEGTTSCFSHHLLSDQFS